jgi:hypothetical protein
VSSYQDDISRSASRPFEDEPCIRQAARSVRELCRASPVFREARALGVESLISEVEEDPERAARLVRFSQEHPPSPTLIAGCQRDDLAGMLIRDLLDHGVDEVIAVGTGSAGQQFADCASSAGLRIRFFADNDESRHGESVDAIPIVAPDEAWAASGVPFVACSLPFAAEMTEQLAARFDGEPRLVFSWLNSWQLKLEADPRLAAADAACRVLLRETIRRRAPWAAVFLLCNYRWFAQQWSAPAAAQGGDAGPSPFVYQMH